GTFNGCTRYDTVVITVNTGPVIDAGTDQTICKGDSVQLMASGTSEYFWMPNLNITDTAIANPVVYPDTSQEYIIKGNSGSGCFGYDTIQIIVKDLPDIFAGND